MDGNISTCFTFYSIQNRTKGKSVLQISIFDMKVVVAFQKKTILNPLWVQLGKSEWYHVILLGAYSVYFQSHTFQIIFEHCYFQKAINTHLLSETKGNINHVCLLLSGRLLAFWVRQLVATQSISELQDINNTGLQGTKY